MLGQHVRLEVVIEESYEFKVGQDSDCLRLIVVWRLTGLAVLQSTVDKLLKKTNLALVIGTSSWREQFLEAITVSSGKKPDPHRNKVLLRTKAHPSPPTQVMKTRTSVVRRSCPPAWTTSCTSSLSSGRSCSP